MYAEHNDITDITRRLAALEKLERHNRLLRATCAASIMALGLALLMAAGPVSDGEIDIRKLILRGPDGNIRCQLDVDASGTVRQSFLDTNGTERLVLNVPKTGEVSVQLFHAPNDMRAKLAVDKDGSAGQFLANKDGAALSSVVFNDGTVFQSFDDSKKQKRIINLVTSDGMVHQRIADTAGRARFNLETDAQDNLLMELLDSVSKRFTWLVYKDGSAMQGLYDKDGKLRIAMAAHQNGDAAQWFSDSASKKRVEIKVGTDGVASQQFNDATHARLGWATTPDGRALHGIFDNTGKNRFTTSTDANGNAYEVISGLHNHRMITIAPANGGIGQMFYGEGTSMKVGTIINSNGTASHYVEKSAIDNAGTAIDWGLRIISIIQLFAI
jgi:hypothetical protein